MTAVMWFRRDLRLEDNQALKYAMEESENVCLLFHVNPEQFLEKLSINQAAFFTSVEKLRKQIEKKGGRLQILYGDIEDCFIKLNNELKQWTDVYINRDEKGYGLKRDKKIVHFFKRNQIQVHGYFDHHLHSANEIKTKAGTPYKVFTPYYNQWKQLPKPTPAKVEFERNKVLTELLFERDEEKYKNMLGKLKELKKVELGSEAAHTRLEEFIEDYLNKYKEARDYPAKDSTSHLSKHLRAGEISIRTVYNRVNHAPNSKGKETFIQELAWRDFYNMIYAANPNQKEVSIDKKFREIRWDNRTENFHHWKEGNTGFPIVDAAMRQLKEKGWMHNRLRMITASFLTKDLLIDWRWGEKYFQEMLIDYDPCSNIGGWQWAASTGTDGVPYFRIFNPTTQSERYDKDGTFIRQYIPELKAIESKKIHAPSTLTDREQENYGIKVGEDYPFPIVNHKQSRELAIKAYEKSKETYQKQNE